MLRIHFADHLTQGRIFILDAVSFVDDQISPIDLRKLIPLPQDALIRRNEYIPIQLSGRLVLLQVLPFKHQPLLFGASHADDSNSRAPFFEFSVLLDEHNHKTTLDQAFLFTIRQLNAGRTSSNFQRLT
jgi:hypothetical protein